MQMQQMMGTQQFAYAQAPAMAYAGAPTMEVGMPAVQYAQPAMAAPMAYEYAQPAMAYAPQQMMAAPMVETVQYAQPTMTTMSPSYAPMPQMQMQMPMQQVFAAPPPQPVAPVRLTEGIPTPDQIAKQKAGYSAALDKQLTEATAIVKRETDIEKQMIKFNAEKNIALYAMQVEEALAEQQALAEEQTTFAKLELKKAFVERTLQLNAQAANLTLDYEMKAAQMELQMKQYQFQVQYATAENKLAAEYNDLVAKGNTGTAVR